MHDVLNDILYDQLHETLQMCPLFILIVYISHQFGSQDIDSKYGGNAGMLWNLYSSV